MDLDGILKVVPFWWCKACVGEFRVFVQKYFTNMIVILVWTSTMEIYRENVLRKRLKL